jgi:hypothetical protein
MPVYLTEHNLSGMTEGHLRSVRIALAEISRRLTVAGTPIQLLECSYAPDGRLVCRFAATSELNVLRGLELAQLPLPAICRPIDHADPSEEPGH